VTRLWVGQLENGSSLHGGKECSLDHRVHTVFMSNPRPHWLYVQRCVLSTNYPYPLKRVINTSLIPGWGSHRAIIGGLQKGIFAGSSWVAKSYPLSLARSPITNNTQSTWLPEIIDKRVILTPFSESHRDACSCSARQESFPQFMESEGSLVCVPSHTDEAHTIA